MRLLEQRAVVELESMESPKGTLPLGWLPAQHLLWSRPTVSNHAKILRINTSWGAGGGAFTGSHCEAM